MERIAFLGPAGTYGHEAAELFFGANALVEQGLSCSSNRSVVKSVGEGRAKYGIVPIENSTEGPVGETLDALNKQWEEGKPVYPCGTSILPIAHCLLSLHGSSLNGIHEIRTHIQAHGQCQRFIRKHLPDAIFTTTSSTAGAAQAIRRGQYGCGAIASRRAGELYGLKVLASDIHDQLTNRTRFLVLSNESDHWPTGQDETLLAVSSEPEIAGSLVQVLQPLADAGLNTHMIVSQQLDLGQYLFYIGFAGHQRDTVVQSALAMVSERSRQLCVFGSYPAAKIE